MQKDSHTGWVRRAFAGGMLKWVGFQVAALAGPAVLGFITTALGRFGGGVPWMWAIAAGALSFGGAAAGIHYTLAVIDRYAVRGRLALVNPRVAVNPQSGSVSLGVNLQSLSDVAIEFEIREIRTQISGQFASSKPFANTTFEIPPRGQGFFSDHAIDLKKTDIANKVISGSVVATIAYGRPGSRTHVLSVNCGIHLSFSTEGLLENMSWEILA